jgi:hypothetical protein
MGLLMIKRIFRQFGRKRPNELIAALLAIPFAELVRCIVELFATGELRFKTQTRGARTMCGRFYEYHKANPHVAGWFLQAAQTLKQKEHRKRYGIGALTEQIRWNVREGIIKTEGFRISNDIRACYARLVLMREPSLCGFFAIKPSVVDGSLVIDGCSWLDFADAHKNELWPEQTGNQKKPAASVRPLSEERHGSQ